jgi:hypothetical protein
MRVKEYMKKGQEKYEGYSLLYDHDTTVCRFGMTLLEPSAL